MSILSVIEGIEDSVVEEAKVLAGKLESFLRGEAEKVVAAAASTDFGTTMLNLMSLAESNPAKLTGAEKMAAVVNAAIKIGRQFLDLGGWSGVFLAVEHFLAGVVQFLFADFIKAFQPKAV